MTEANLDAAFALANKWRAASGQDIMDAWFPAQPQEPESCLLALAFNRDCRVDYLGDGPSGFQPGSGRIEFYNDEDATEFADVTGFAHDAAGLVGLPDEIALVAWEFDQGSYPEYVAARLRT